jgi:hypothetical protein
MIGTATMLGTSYGCSRFTWSMIGGRRLRLVRKAYRLLRRILNVAVEAGCLPRNPAAIKGAGLERAGEIRHVSIPQLHALAEAVPGRYRSLVLVAGYGGLR